MTPVTPPGIQKAVVAEPEVAEKLRKRVKEYQEGEADTYTLEELDEELRLSE